MKKIQVNLKKLELKKEKIASLSFDSSKIVGGATIVEATCGLTCGCPGTRNCPSVFCSQLTIGC